MILSQQRQKKQIKVAGDSKIHYHFAVLDSLASV
jgi:hypothetical protein